MTGMSQTVEVTFTVRVEGPNGNGVSFLGVDLPNGVTHGQGFRDDGLVAAVRKLVALPVFIADLAESIVEQLEVPAGS